LFSQSMRSTSGTRPIQRLRTVSSAEQALARQRRELNVVKREHWKESDLENLPEGEPDVFDRKSGRLFDNRDKFLDGVAKALSAFANSGGGSLILGVSNDGVPDGLPPREGKTSMREWLEQKIPALLDYPLGDFRVHTVSRSENSRIPSDKEVIVIDVGDSAAAPHQSARDKIYYRREGGHSKPRLISIWSCCVSV
jgi:predicted HTH transcriptional regulator